MSNSLQPHRLFSPWNSPGQNTGVGSLSLLQGIFPTQGLNPGLPHCRQILCQLSPQGSPRTLEWISYPFSRGSSWPRNRTGVSCIADRFFTNWAVREAQSPEAYTSFLPYPWHQPYGTGSIIILILQLRKQAGFLKIYLPILSLTALGVGSGVGFLQSRPGGLLYLQHAGVSCFGAQALGARGQYSWCSGLVVPKHVGSAGTWHWTVFCRKLSLSPN